MDDEELLAELKKRPKTVIVHRRPDRRWYACRRDAGIKANLEPVGDNRRRAINFAVQNYQNWMIVVLPEDLELPWEE